jgi:hypothetical protein
MNEMKQLLLQLPRLQHLELKGRLRKDVADGYQWEVLTHSLITFNFKFTVSHVDPIRTRSSFCTPFWLEEKRWFIAHDYFSLFSIPYFAPNEIDISEPPNICFTAPNITYLYNNVNKITIKAAEIKHNHYFTHVQTLELECRGTISLEKIQLALDLNCVEHLIVSSVDNLLVFMPLKSTMPQLYKLTFHYCNIADGFEQTTHYQFEQILTLELRYVGMFTDYIIEELFRLFPSVQHLEIEHDICLEEIMIHSIDGFKHLSNASFRKIISRVDLESNLCQNVNTIIPQPQKLTSENFIARVYDSSYNRLIYNWWIDNQASNIRTLRQVYY